MFQLKNHSIASAMIYSPSDYINAYSSNTYVCMYVYIYILLMILVIVAIYALSHHNDYGSYLMENKPLDSDYIARI